MYIPPHFQESRFEVLHELMKKHPFGILVTNGRSGMDANHIPFELDVKCGEFGTLHAHVARANPLWQDVQNDDEVLAIFQAEHAYISPTWYPSKHESHKQVPTWNYMVVHARGKVLIHDDERYVRGMVARLTRTHEADQPQPWKMTDSPKEFIDMMLKNIVGIEILITQLVGKFKLGQNRETRDMKGAGEALKAQGDILLGQAMVDRAAAEPER